MYHFKRTIQTSHEWQYDSQQNIILCTGWKKDNNKHLPFVTNDKYQDQNNNHHTNKDTNVVISNNKESTTFQDFSDAKNNVADDYIVNKIFCFSCQRHKHMNGFNLNRIRTAKVKKKGKYVFYYKTTLKKQQWLHLSQQWISSLPYNGTKALNDVTKSTVSTC